MKTLLTVAVAALVAAPFPLLSAKSADKAKTSAKTSEKSSKSKSKKAKVEEAPETAATVRCADADPFQSPTNAVPMTPIDKLVFAQLKKAGLQPAKDCSDAVFVRRVYLDVIGTMPTTYEVTNFLADVSPTKRSALIEQLLKRDEFASYWALKWGDVLRIRAEFPINLWPNAAQAYHRYVHTCLEENVPYDRFARELLTSSGSNFRVPPVNFYRAMQNRNPEGIAQSVALTFLGMRAENWPKEELAGLAAFFQRVGYKSTGEWKEEIVANDPALATNGVVQALLPDGKKIKVPLEGDPRKLFADWLITPKNPWFTRNIANRVWYWLMGRGIIHEPDDLRADNPPSNPELLTLLEKELIKANYDLKHLYRLILNSKTYQLSSLPAPGTEKDEVNFSHYLLRRMEAEVLIDALCQISGTTEQYYSAIPEPFTFLPDDVRSIDLPDSSISSSFLELFGRPPRATGLEMERNYRPTSAQRLHMLNSTHIQKKLENGKNFQRLFAAHKNMEKIIEGVYLMVLSRYPTEEELKTGAALVPPGQGSSKSRAEAAVDVAWALFNSSEFMYRH